MKWSGKSNRTLLAVAALAVAVSTCSYKQHNAETRDIPEVLQISSNLGVTKEDFMVRVETVYYALREHWYCTEWGNAGLGNPPQRLRFTDTLLSPNDTLLVPLRVQRKTFCPYVLAHALVDVKTRHGIGRHCYISLSPDSTYPAIDAIQTFTIGYAIENGENLDFRHIPELKYRFPAETDAVLLNLEFEQVDGDE